MGKEEAAGPRKSAARVSDDPRAQKKMGALSKMYTKMASSVGIVEKTSLEPRFLDEMKTIENYRFIIDALLAGLEFILQPDEKLLAARQFVDPQDCNPWEIARINLHCMSKKCEGKKASYDWICDLAYRLAEQEREGSLKSREAMRRVRRFVTADYDKMQQMVENLDSCLVEIDSHRHEVKLTKTAEQLEVSGKNYQKAIREFDKQAREINEVIDEMPELLYKHQMDMYKFYHAQENTHNVMAGLIRDAIKKFSG